MISKGTLKTPKRIEIKEDEYSNYSQIPTPVQEYRNKSWISNINIKIENGEKRGSTKFTGPESFKLAGKAKSINKSVITVKEEQAYSSLTTHKDLKNPKYPSIITPIENFKAKA